MYSTWSIVGVENYSKLKGMASKALPNLPLPILQTTSLFCSLSSNTMLGSLGGFVHVVAFVWNALISPVPPLSPQLLSSTNFTST